jgi:hypothetical protein
LLSLGRVKELALGLRERPNATRLLLFVCVAALALAAVSVRLTRKLPFTGDEPRYLLKAVSLASHAVDVIPESRNEELRASEKGEMSPVQDPFRNLLQRANWADARIPHHPILTSLVLAPMTATRSLEIIRLLPFAIGITGLCFLAATLVKQTRSRLSALACFVPAVFGFPALPYQFLALPEIFLFALSAIAFWDLCSGPREKISGYATAIVCSCVAPLVHMRGLALFAATGLYLICLLRRTANGRRLAIAGFIFLGALTVFLLSNWFLGRWLGAVNAHPVWKTHVVLDMFIHYRHGLLPYAPIWLLSFAGLIAGLRARKPWALPALFFLVAFLAGNSHAIGEAYPGRFWVQTVPVLALCLTGFTEGAMRTAVKATIYLPLAALSLANSVIFFADPGLHLAARSGGMPYDFLFKILPAFHFSFWLDVPGSSYVRIAAICFCALVAGIVALASITGSKALQLSACFLVLIGFEAHRVTPVPITTAAETNAIVVRARQNAEFEGRPLRLRFQAPWKEVGPRPDESTRPVVEVVDGNTRWKTPIMSGSVLVHKSASPWNDFSITLRWIDRDPMQLDPAAPGADFEMLACNSVFARFW